LRGYPLCRKSAKGINIDPNLFRDFLEALIAELESNKRPLMLVIAGHNGAGKSTCYREHLADGLRQHIQEHIDPDAVERSIRADFNCQAHGMTNDDFSKLAQQESNRLRQQYVANGISFSFETVLSDPVGEKVDFMKKAVDMGYLVALLAVGLDSPEKSRYRVDLRVLRGGHDVPTDRIFKRYPRVIENIKKAADVVSLAVIADNSNDNQENEDGAYMAFSLHMGGRVVKTIGQVPAWWV
jgi:predicted ABC-type ATPase